MKHILFFQRFFASLLLLAVSSLSWASDFKVDGIYYNRNSDGESVTVTYWEDWKSHDQDGSYSGSVVIPSSVTYGGKTYDVTSIGKDALEGSHGLTSITIPNSVTSIGNGAFNGCSGLVSVTIPENVTSIGDYAFRACSGLTSINVASGNTNYDSRNNCNAIIETATNTLVTGCKNTVIPNSVTSIGDNAFYASSGLTSITIPNGVTSIGKYAFIGCSSLTSVTIPNSVTSIGDGAFSSSGIKSIEIPNGVTSIGNHTFGDSGLKSIIIPESVTSIGNSAFYHCPLTSVTCRAEDVPTTGTSVFYSESTAILYVPESALDAYKAADQWKEFGQILPIDDDDRIYIETDLTSQFPVDWQGWNGATGYVGWAAPQVTTNDGRETPACEKFNGSSAEQGTVFTRTLTGLANGTYRIELYGAAASTKGRDTGIDSEMTASDEGDETAVYLYAKTANGTVKQYIPVHWATSFAEIATAVLNGVTVTDGTVELGMVSEKKFTNWEVIQIKGVTALVDAIELHANTLNRAQTALDDEAYLNVTGEERTALSQAIADNTTVSQQTAEAYLAAINALETATKAFTDAKASYEGFAAAKTLTDGLSYLYATEAKKSAAEIAAAAVATSAADAISKTDALLTAYRQYAESSAMLEGVDGATNMTSYINNPKAEEGVDGWTTVKGEGSDGSISILDAQPWTDGSGDTNHKYFDGGNWGASAWDVAFKQDITLPAGKYQLTAIGRSEQDVALTLFAGDEMAEMAHISSVGGLFNNGWEQTSVEFELTGNTTVSIGVRGVTSVIHNWMSFSDFRLVQFPENIKVISFADANVKAICVANWDTNGDEELDEDEAAAVTSLGEVFKNNTSITSFDELRYFTGLTTIGEFAFSGCTGLTSVIIPNGVTNIDADAFCNCFTLTSVTIPNGMTSIGDRAFSSCTGLTSINIPESVTSISDAAFIDCTGLPVIDNISYADTYLVEAWDKTQSTYNIKAGTRFIGASAFSYCSSLTSVTIPESVTSIGQDAFSYCSELASISIPNNVTSISSSAFSYCSSLTSINIPNSVTSIGDNAFRWCSGLTSVTIPNSVTSIGDFAFSGCSGLTSVTIPEGVTNIGYYAFSGCSGLTSITIPENVTSIDAGAFNGCSGLASICVDTDNSVYDSRNDCNAIIETATNTLTTGCKNTVIPESVTSIGNSAFSGCSGLTSITIPESVTSIGNSAFSDCSGLTSINIPNSVTSIGGYAFAGCSNLTSVTIPNSVTSIGIGAFNGCSGLTSINIPNSVTSIGNGAFSRCTGLTSITIPNSVTSIGDYAFQNCSGLTSVNNLSETPQNISDDTFTNRANATLYVPKGCKAAYEAANYWKEFKEIIEIKNIINFVDANVKAICVANWDTNGDGELDEDEAAAVTSLGSVFKYKTTITSFDELQYFTGLTAIGDEAFQKCSGLTSVTIPNSVTSIDHWAFYNCSSLTSITIPNSVTSIGLGAFSDCSGVTSLTIGSGVTSIGQSAFYNCSGITSVTIPESVTRIGQSAFYGCSGLTRAEFANIESLCKYSFVNASSNPLYYAHHLYIEGQEVQDLVIPETVTSIGNYAFSGCSNLTSVTIPESVTSIGGGAFSGCSGVTSVTIGNNVTSIGGSAFSGCSSLTFITIPNSVTSIGQRAFNNCSGLTRAEFASIGSLCSISFYDVYANPLYYAHHLYVEGQEVQDVVIPEGVTSIGDHTFFNCSYLTSINISSSVTNIGYSAFSGCSSLTSINIPNNVTSIKAGAFTNCTSLPVIDNIRYADTYLVEAVNKTQSTYNIKEGTRFIGSNAFRSCSSLTSVTIPENVTSIDNYAFWGCTSLTSITIPNSVKSIGYGAFRDCSGLISITIPNSVTSIDDWTFDNCSGLTSVTIPNSVTSIGQDAFSYCSGLTSITIPNSVTSIGSSAFDYCSSLKSVNVLAETPSSIQSHTFPPTIAKIRVPEAAVSAYKAATNWSSFSSKIMALGGEDNSITVEEIEENKAAGGSANQTYIVTDAAADDVKAADNVIVHSGDNYTCANLVLSDGEPFETMAEEFTATAATYTRSVSVGNTSGTICVPYAFAKEDGVKYYTVDNTRSDDETIYLSEVSGDVVPAATPIIYFKDGGKTTMTFSGSNAVAKKAAGTGSGTFELRGTFEKTTITESDELAKSYALSGGKFLCSTTKLTINPFRAYLYNTGAVAGARLDLSVEDEEPTGITSENAALMSGDAEIEGYYTLDGKRVGSLQKGAVTVIRYANGKSVKVFAK